MVGTDVGSGYGEHLTDEDLRLLASASHTPAGVSDLRRHPERIPGLLDHPRVFEAVFGAVDRSPALVSPFLTFSVAVNRAAGDLASVSYVPERSGLRGRIPLFDAPALRGFLEEPARRLFLAELLASFTRVASGRYRVRRGSSWQTRRFSELDPVRMAGLLEAVPAAERPGVFRRLGDVALFLTGIFPGYAAATFGPVDAERLFPAAREAAGGADAAADGPDAGGPAGYPVAYPGAVPAIELLERLGARWYHNACALAAAPTDRLTVVADVADRFSPARRVLNQVADRYLFPAGNPWFPAPAG
jgi:hypothetical protein